MLNLLANLPAEITDLILEYHGYHRLRNGKYMRRLCIEDTKYDELKTKPLIKLDKNNVYKASFQKIKNGRLICYTISTAIYSNKIHWYMDITCPLYKKQTAIANYILIYSLLSPKLKELTYHYVFEHNDKQHSSVIKF